MKRTQDGGQTEPGLVAFYDIWPGNGAGLFFDCPSEQSSTAVLWASALYCSDASCILVVFPLIFLQQTVFFGISESVSKFVTRRRSNPEQLRYRRFTICPLKLVEKHCIFAFGTEVANRNRSISRSSLFIRSHGSIRTRQKKPTETDKCYIL